MGGSGVKVWVITGTAVKVLVGGTDVAVGAFKVILAAAVWAAWVLTRFWSMVGASVSVGAAAVGIAVGAVVAAAVGTDMAVFKLQLLKIIATIMTARILFSINFEFMCALQKYFNDLNKPAG